MIPDPRPNLCAEYGPYSPTGVICNGFQSGAAAVIQQVEMKGLQYLTGFMNGNLGAYAGAGTHLNLLNFLQQINFGNLTGVTFAEIRKSIDQGITNLNISDAARQISEELDRSFTSFRTMSTQQWESMLREIVSGLSAAARDYVTTVLPFMLLTSSVMLATPLSIYYLYKKMVYNIGKPKLAGEVFYNSPIDRAIEWTKDAVIAGAHGVRSGIKAGFITAAAISTLASSFIFSAGVSEAIHALSKVDKFKHLETIPRLGDYELTRNAVDNSFGIFESIGQLGSPYYTSNQNYTFRDMLAICWAVGLIYGVKRTASIGYEAFLKSRKGEPAPIFSTSLQEVIDGIAASVKHIKQHGGIFQNVLLHGPGGTGKTLVAKYIARQSGMNYRFMSGGDLAQYIKRGEHVTELNQLFEDMKNSPTPTILFIDEAESLCMDRDRMKKSELLELLNAFLNHTGEPSRNFMLILATNRLGDLDDAVLSRMDHKLHIAPPASEERKKMLDHYLNKAFSKAEMRKFFDEATVLQIAEETEGLTGRAISKMVNALVGHKNASADNKLTEDMISRTVAHFVEQEREVSEMRGKLEPGEEVEGVSPFEPDYILDDELEAEPPKTLLGRVKALVGHVWVSCRTLLDTITKVVRNALKSLPIVGKYFTANKLSVDIQKDGPELEEPSETDVTDKPIVSGSLANRLYRAVENHLGMRSFRHIPIVLAATLVTAFFLREPHTKRYH